MSFPAYEISAKGHLVHYGEEFIYEIKVSALEGEPQFNMASFAGDRDEPPVKTWPTETNLFEIEKLLTAHRNEVE